MKRIKRALAAVLLLALAFLAVGCSGQDDGTFVVREKVFASTILAMYNNTTEYLDKTVKLEGMMLTGSYGEGEDAQAVHYVYRLGPGCCSNDAFLGLEVIWPQGQEQEFPLDNAWVEAVGHLETYEEDGNQYLRLVLDTLTELEKRGKETVTN